MAFSTNIESKDSLKIHVMPEDIYNEIKDANGIADNEIYFVEGSEDTDEDTGPVSLADGGTGVSVTSVAELRTVLSVAAADHTSYDSSCGIGTGLKFGHVKLSDDYELISDATKGIAVTPKALNDVYKIIKELIDSKADINSTGTIASTLLGFAEVAEWSDGNKTEEDRIGYFVTSDTSKQSINIIKANPTSNVRGVTIEKPGFVANAGDFKYDSEGNLLPKYDYVLNAGLVSVIDDGTCVVGKTCIPNYSGIATPSTNEMGYPVVSRIDEKHIMIFMEPQAISMVNLRNEMDNKQNLLTWTTMDDIDAMIAGTYDPETIGGAIDADDNLLIFLVNDK